MEKIISIVKEQISIWIQLWKVTEELSALVNIPVVSIPASISLVIWVYKKLKKRKFK